MADDYPTGYVPGSGFGKLDSPANYPTGYVAGSGYGKLDSPANYPAAKGPVSGFQDPGGMGLPGPQASDPEPSNGLTRFMHPNAPAWYTNGPVNASVSPRLSSPRTGSYGDTVTGDMGSLRDVDAPGRDKASAGYFGEGDTGVKTAEPGYRQGAGYIEQAASALTPQTTEDANAFYQGQRIAQQAREQQDTQQQREETNAQAERARLDTKIAGAERERQVDKFLANNGVVPGSVTSVTRAGRLQSNEPKLRAATYGQEAGADTARLAALEAERAGVAKGAVAPRNFVQEAGQLYPMESQLGAAEQRQKLTLGGLAGQEQGQKLQMGDLALHVQQHLTDLQTQPAGTGPGAEKAREALAFYQKAQSGKGGPITPEESLGHFSTMIGGVLQRLAAMGQSGDQLVGAIPGLYQQWTQMTGLSQKPAPTKPASMQEFLSKAKAANPGMSDAELRAIGRSTYGLTD